jgi:hypothetical protein
MLRIALVVLAVFGLSFTSASAAPVTYAFTGVINQADDFGSFLGGRFSVGNTFTGQVTYDTSAPDTSPLLNFGSFHPIASIEVEFDHLADPISTQSLPPSFLNMSDHQFQLVFEHIPLFGISPAVNIRVALQLTAPGDVFDPNTLPTELPTLDNFPASQHLFISGLSGFSVVFAVAGRLTSLEPLPEPISLALFGIGIAAIGLTRRKIGAK